MGHIPQIGTSFQIGDLWDSYNTFVVKQVHFEDLHLEDGDLIQVISEGIRLKVTSNEEFEVSVNKMHAEYFSSWTKSKPLTPPDY